MRCYQTIRRTPLRELTFAEHGVLQLEDAMLQIRKKANEIREKPWMDANYIRYSIGFFNGVRFTIIMALSCHDPDYKDFNELADRYASEADYLAGPYIEGT